MLSNNGSGGKTATLQEAVSPVLDSGLSLKETRLILQEMYVNSVSNAPVDEIENFTARRHAPVYMALMAFLENLQEVNPE